jgi:tRNA(Ile)-lysidine synthase TilS/MesJ
MRCDRCRRGAIHYQTYSGKHLCEHHFSLDIERRAKRMLRQKGWIHTGDRIAVALRGDLQSRALLHFLTATFAKRRDLSFFTIAIDEGIQGYRVCDQVEDISRSYGLECITRSYQKEFGYALDLIMQKGEESNPCPYCQMLRHRLLQKVAQEQGATRIATGATLNDTAHAVFVTILKGDVSQFVSRPAAEIPEIHPFSSVPADEVTRYALIHGNKIVEDRCPYFRSPTITRKILEDFSSHHPATGYALMNLRETLLRTSKKETTARSDHDETKEDICHSHQNMEGT